MRGVDEYSIDVREMVNEVIKRKGRARVLDVGAANGKMLKELKEIPVFRGKVETCALTPDDMPHYPADHRYLAFAEHMPEHLRGKFDVAVANWSLEYSPLLHIAVRNMAHSLAPGGEARIALSQSKFNRFEDDEKLAAYFSKLSNADAKAAEAFNSLIRLEDPFNEFDFFRIERLKAELQRLGKANFRVTVNNSR